MGTSIDSGHYTATTKNPMDGKWRYFDDMVVKDVNSPIDVETSTVYLLFYEKRSAKRQLTCSSSGQFIFSMFAEEIVFFALRNFIVL